MILFKLCLGLKKTKELKFNEIFKEWVSWEIKEGIREHNSGRNDMCKICFWDRAWPKSGKKPRMAEA